MRGIQYWIVDLAPNIFRIIILIDAFFMLVRPVFGQEQSGIWRPGFKGHGTIHEQLGQLHFPEVTYEKYVSKAKYTQEREYSQMFMGPIFAFTHSLFDFLSLRNTSFLLPDYVEQTNSNIFTLGQKYERNDWVKLLAENRFLIILWILPLLISIVVMPFIATIYCCFYCWRCKKPCAPCYKPDRKRLIYSLVLFLLIIGLVLAFAIAILSHKQMIRNVGYTNERLQRGSKDICAFLKDVSNHLHHLLVTNLEKLKDHISDESYEAHRHIFLDLVDTSDGNALTELEKILVNMPEAWETLAQIDKAEKNLRFYNSMYRDGLRGAKRDLILALVSLCRLKNCIDFVRDYTKIDSSKCLHIDDMPNTTLFLNAADQAIKNNLVKIPQAALRRLQEVGQTIKNTIAPVIPPILTRFDYAASQYKEEYILMNDIIEAAISDIHLRTIKSAKSFEDINEKFGPDRKLYTNIACLLLFLILIALIFSLVYGLFVRNNNTGSNCMILAISLIFCTFSFITLVGLFHYVLGMVTYQATCKNFENMKTVESNTVQMSDTLSGCREDQNIVDWMTENQLYDTDRLWAVNIEKENTEIEGVVYTGNLSSFALVSIPEENLINKTLFNLYPYRSQTYTEILCKELTNPKLQEIHDQLDHWNYFTMYKVNKCGTVGTAIHIACIVSNWVEREFDKLLQLENVIHQHIDAIKQRVLKLDGLISVKEKRNFGETIMELTDTIKRSEDFIRERGSDFINTIGLNLTHSMEEQLQKYRNMTVTEITKNVGRCSHIAYIQDHGTKYACRTLIDPINGFWVGLLISSVLFLPILYVAHRLVCLYRSDPDLKPIVYLVRSDGVDCPTCTGAPYKPHPVVICGGGQQKNCQCPLPEDMKKNLADIEVGFSKSKRE